MKGRVLSSPQCSSLYFNILGSNRDVNMAAYRIQSILHKNGYNTKVVNSKNGDNIPIINKQLLQHYNSREKYATIMNCSSCKNDTYFTFINRYIRKNSNSFVRPCALYAIDYSSIEKDQMYNKNDELFQKYSQINIVFDVNAPIDEHVKQIELFMEI